MTPISEIIRHEIQKCGILPFARFMELALYCPEFGYYEIKKDIGRRGDFYTSVSVGDLFGRLLAFQFAEWLGQLPASGRGLCIVESGAHDGQLAADILGWLQTARPELFGQIQYYIIEPSPRRREWQNETLRNFVQRVRWFSHFNASTVGPFNGIIFTNEFLDALPVHRHGWDAAKRKWFEWGVALEGGQCVWAKIEDSDFQFPIPELEPVLPDGYTVEYSPAAEGWWREAANNLGQGWLLTFDYGDVAEGMFSPGRARGTLRAYHRHHATHDILANPGEQDLTAHVNFSAIRQAGEAAGLKTDFFGPQARFLTGILSRSAGGNALGDWGAKQTRKFQTLTHPEHLGRAFSVLVQMK
jgi:SAM-dependent MidA family methyltransferase